MTAVANKRGARIIPRPPEGAPPARLRDVLTACCVVAGSAPVNLIDGNRRAATVLCRALYAYCGRTLTLASSPEIAESIYGPQVPRWVCGKYVDTESQSTIAEASVRVHKRMDWTVAAYLSPRYLDVRACKFDPYKVTMRELVGMVEKESRLIGVLRMNGGGNGKVSA